MEPRSSEGGARALEHYRAASVEHVDAGDAVVACRRFGSGPALLLVHGFPLHGFTWRKVLPRLAWISTDQDRPNAASL